MANGVTFTAVLEKSPSKGGWHYVRLSDELRSELATLSGKNGNVPVVVTIGTSTWPSTTMSMGQQQWYVAVKTSVRQAEGIGEGDQVSMSLTPDPKRLKSKD